MKPVIHDSSVPYKERKTFKYMSNGKGEFKFDTIFYYTFKNFQKLLKYAFPKINKIRLFVTRGFTDGQYIYLLEKDHWYSKIGHKRMIQHELKHIEGKKHRWWVPDVMHPSFLFRWSDKVWE